MKIISFSLWGSNTKYTTGAIRNAELAPVIYPGWKCRFYAGLSTPEKVVKQLEVLGAEVIEMPEQGDWRATLWRFLPASDANVEIMVSRDCDSRLNRREKSAVDEWIKSNKAFHIMRDHPQHNSTIMGGMWGLKKGVIPDMKSLLEKLNQRDIYQIDQWFLRQQVYPLIFDKAMVHDPFFENKPFPSPRSGNEFVGEPFEGSGERDEALAGTLDLPATEKIQYAFANRWMIEYDGSLAKMGYWLHIRSKNLFKTR